LASRWISPEVAEAAFLRRVDSGEGGGIAIPYFRPGTSDFIGRRLLPDGLDVTPGVHGLAEARRQCFPPPGGVDSVYVPPQVELAQLADGSLPLVLCTGEFEALALWRLAEYGSFMNVLPFVAIAQQSPWDWRPPEGLVLADRRTVVLSPPAVGWHLGVSVARDRLTRVLELCGAEVAWFCWPASVSPEVTGIGDFLTINGPEVTLRLLADSKVITRRKPSPAVQGGLDAREPVARAPEVAPDPWEPPIIERARAGGPVIIVDLLREIGAEPDKGARDRVGKILRSGGFASSRRRFRGPDGARGRRYQWALE
jgi:hypothetical protein